MNRTFNYILDDSGMQERRLAPKFVAGQFKSMAYRHSINENTK
jgi:hypothetical protein